MGGCCGRTRPPLRSGSGARGRRGAGFRGTLTGSPTGTAGAAGASGSHAEPACTMYGRKQPWWHENRFGDRFLRFLRFRRVSKLYLRPSYRWAPQRRAPHAAAEETLGVCSTWNLAGGRSVRASAAPWWWRVVLPMTMAGQGGSVGRAGGIRGWISFGRVSPTRYATAPAPRDLLYCAPRRPCLTGR